jgi:hypothetical protein
MFAAGRLSAEEDSVNQEGRLYDEIYSGDVVMARVGHLTRSMRQDVEQIVRILREDFPVGGILRPAPQIAKVFLLGLYGQRCWRMNEERDAIPAYEFWVVLSDRLLTHKRLWQETEARIRDSVKGRCTAALSYASVGGVRAGQRSHDEYVVARLKSGIILFDAKRDAPHERRGRGRSAWTAALDRFRDAEAAFLPATQALRDAERQHFAERHRPTDYGRTEDDHCLVEAKVADEQFGDALHEALMALLHTPAPDLGAVILKLELVRDNGDGDDHAIISLLSDIRRIAARIAECGRLQ